MMIMNSTVRDYRRLLQGAACVAAIAAASVALPGEAAAQQRRPGGPNCPIVDIVATCSGDLKNGIVYGAGDPPIDELRVENVTGAIAPPGYFAIGMTRADRDQRLTIADGVVINTVDDPAIAGPAQGVIVIGGSGRDATVTSGAAITVDGNGQSAVGIEVAINGAGADAAVTNRGAINVDTDAQRSIGISVAGGNSTGTAQVTNSGALSVRSGGTGERDQITAGILITGSGQSEHRITNSGNVTIRTAPGTFDTDFEGEALAIGTNSFGTTRTTILNTGNLTGIGPNASGILAFTRNNVAATPSVIDITNRGILSMDGNFNYGILAQGAGAAVNMNVLNQGAINIANGDGTEGILALVQSQRGTTTVTNEAAITIGGTGPIRGIGVLAFGAPPAGTYNLSIANSGAITLTGPQASGITMFGTLGDTIQASITNSGNLSLPGSTNLASDGIRVAFDGTQPDETTPGASSLSLRNSGNIEVGAGNAVDVRAGTINVENSGALSTTGAGSHAVTLTNTGTGGVLNFSTSGNVTAGGADTDAVRITSGGAVQINVADAATISASGSGTVAAFRIGSAVPATAQSVPDMPGEAGVRMNVEGAIRAATGTAIDVRDVAGFFLDARGALIEGGEAAISSSVVSTVTLNAGSVVTGNVRLSEGVDRFGIASSTFTGGLFLGDGNDFFNSGNSVINGNVAAGAGDDSIAFILSDQPLVLPRGLDGGTGIDDLRFSLNGFDTSVNFDGIAITGIERVSSSGRNRLTLTGSNEFAATYELVTVTSIIDGVESRVGLLTQNAILPNVDFVTSAGSILTLGGRTRDLALGGDLVIEGGADPISRNAILAPNAADSVNARVTGAGTSWTLADLTVGGQGSAALTIADGALVRSDRITVGSQGLIAIGGSLNAQGQPLAAAVPGSIETPSLTLAGSGSGGALLFNHNGNSAANYSFAPAVSGGANARILHVAGVTTFTGDSGGFAGTTSVSGGTLRLTGALGGTTTIGSGGTLTGTGTLGNLIVAGTLAPGGAPGTLTTTGNVTFAAGSTFQIELQSAGGGDRLNAGGTATINGGNVAVGLLDPETSYQQGSVFRFLNAAGGRTGEFAGLSETSAFLDFLLGYDPTGAFLTVQQVLTFPDVALTFNQTQAALGLEALDQTSGSDALAVYNAILMLEDGAARAAFDASSGEIHASVLAAGLRSARGLADPMIGRARGSGPGGIGGWASGQLTDAGIDGDGNAATVSSEGWSGSGGVDWTSATGNVRIGIAAGVHGGETRVADRQSQADLDGWHIGAYGRAGSGGSGFSATGAIVHASGEAAVARRSLFAPIDRFATSTYDVDLFAAQAELRYGFGGRGGGLAFGPLIGADYADVSRSAFTERGAQALNLSGGEDGDTRWNWIAGGFLRWETPGSSIDASVAWDRQEGDFSQTRLTLAGAPGTPFDVRSPASGQDALRLQLFGEFSLGGDLKLGAGYRGSVGGGNDTHSAVLRLSFR